MAKKSKWTKKRKPVSSIGKARGAKKRTSKAAVAKKSPKASVKNTRAPKKKAAALLSKGGGNATAAGVTFQASVGAIFAAQLLAERPLDGRLGLGGVKARSIRFESEAPLDDIAVETTAHGWLLVQAKNSLTLSESLSSELGKTAEQIVSQWAASTARTGERGWDRPLDLTRDRFIIAVGPTASGTITNDLAKALTTLRSSHSAPLPSGQAGALGALKKLLKAAWRKIYGKPAKAADIEKILPFIAVLRLDVGGPDRNTAVEVLAHVTEQQKHAASAFHVLEGSCQSLMVGRLGTDAGLLRASLAQEGISLKAAPSFQDDVATLKKYSDVIASVLRDFEVIEVDGHAVSVTRESSAAVSDAAKAGSLLIIGDPGAGKSAVVNAAAGLLRASKFDVIQLAVDRLQVDTSDGLRSALGLAHPLLTVLENWPGISLSCTRFRRHRVRCFMEQEVRHGEKAVYPGVQA